MLNSIGFLTPEGKLIKCESYDHLNTAEKICKKLKISFSNRLDAESELQQRGYIVVRDRDLYGMTGYLDKNFNEIPLTDKQRKWLQDNYKEMSNEQKICANDILNR